MSSLNVDEIACARCVREIQTIIARTDEAIEKQLSTATEETVAQASAVVIAAVERAVEDIRATVAKYVVNTRSRHGDHVAELVRARMATETAPFFAALNEQLAILRNPPQE